jgi:hypothetical protein
VTQQVLMRITEVGNKKIKLKKKREKAEKRRQYAFLFFFTLKTLCKT